jgi:hypothetical protein
MKRLIFFVITLIISIAFGLIYCSSPIRQFLTANNLGALVNAYNNLDSFFSFIWDKTFNNFVTLGGVEEIRLNIKAIVIIASIFAITNLIVIGIASIVDGILTSSRLRQKQYIKDEKDKLSKIGKTPSSFNNFDTNDINYRNKKIPYVDSVNFDQVNIDTNSVSNRKYRKPIIRPLVVILASILTLFYFLFRFIYLTNYASLKNAFNWICNSKFYEDININLTNMYGYIFEPIYNNVMFNIGGANWTFGLLIEFVIWLVLSLLIIIVYVLIANKVVKNRRLKNIQSQNRKNNSTSISTKAMGILGDFENDDSVGNISTIATISASSSYQIAQKSILQKANYIDDIGYGVEYIGKAEKEEGYIPPSTTRRAYVLEALPDDVTNNEGVTIEDIPSIDESLNNNQSVTVSYVSHELEQEEIDISNADISYIATTSLLENSLNKDNIDDIISFDEDGDAYLVKQGKLFTQGEDISDVYDPYNASMTLLINKYGVKNYHLLDDIEPFNLVPLDVLKEIGEAKNRINQENLMSDIDIINQSLVQQPFQVIKGGNNGK